LGTDDGAPAVTTYYLNRLQSVRSKTNYCVTLNAGDRIDPRRILRTLRFEHPVFTTRRDAAQARHRELLGANRTSYCGAYWRNGFHEDGVVSALAAVASVEAGLSRGAAGLPPNAAGTSAVAAGRDSQAVEATP
jgi:predicted NAD/FAD-binding protein